MPIAGYLYKSRSGISYQCLLVGTDTENNKTKIVYRDCINMDKIYICSIKGWKSLMLG